MTPQGSKRQESLIKKYGSLEALQAEQKKWGSKGGKKTAQGTTGGLKGLTKEQRSAAGRLGYQAMMAKAMREIEESGHIKEAK